MVAFKLLQKCMLYSFRQKITKNEKFVFQATACLGFTIQTQTSCVIVDLKLKMAVTVYKVISCACAVREHSSLRKLEGVLLI